MFAVDVIVGLGSGAFGALGAPWITHRLSTTARLAQRRDEPYARILQAAAVVVEASGARGRVIARMTGADTQLEDAWPALEDAVTAADHVSSPEIRGLASDLKASSTRSVFEHNQIPQKPASEMSLEDLNHAMIAESEMRAAYHALREQVQRETRG